MMYRVLTGTSEVDRKKWEQFIISNPHGTVFQSPDMYDLYSGVSTYTPMILAIEDKNRDLRAVLLAVVMQDYKGLAGKISTRTLIYGGPVVDSRTQEQETLLKMILEALIRLVGKRSLYIQIRNLYDYSVFDPVFRTFGFSKEDHLNLIVHTHNARESMAGISKSKVRQARNSFARGADLAVAETEAEVQELYVLLDKMYRIKIKKPLPPITFFYAFLNASKERKLGMILLARYQGKVIGGMVCPLMPGKALFEWYICGMDKEIPGIHPSVMLTYGAIDFAINNNLPAFDFMGIGSPDVPYGVRDFKTRFGGRTVNYGRYLRVNNRLIFFFAKTGFTLLSMINHFFTGSHHKEKKHFHLHN